MSRLDLMARLPQFLSCHSMWPKVTSNDSQLAVYEALDPFRDFVRYRPSLTSVKEYGFNIAVKDPHFCLPVDDIGAPDVAELGKRCFGFSDTRSHVFQCTSCCSDDTSQVGELVNLLDGLSSDDESSLAASIVRHRNSLTSIDLHVEFVGLLMQVVELRLHVGCTFQNVVTMYCWRNFSSRMSLKRVRS